MRNVVFAIHPNHIFELTLRAGRSIVVECFTVENMPGDKLHEKVKLKR